MVGFFLVMLPITIGVMTLITRGVISVQTGGLLLLIGVLIAERRTALPGVLSVIGAFLTLYIFGIGYGGSVTVQLVTVLVILYGFYVMLRGLFL